MVETGWGPVLREAKAAGIPVILADRAVDVKDDTLYVTFIGSDFVEEGRMAGRWLVENTKGQRRGQHRRAPGHGRLGAGDRPQEGLRGDHQGRPGLKIIRSQTGDFTRAKGKEVMEAFLKAEGKNINGSTRTTTTWRSARSRRSRKPA